MLRVLQFVVSDHAASSHAPCARATQQSGRAAQRRSFAYQLCRVTTICIATDRGAVERARRGSRPSATKPGGEHQAFRRASGPRISTTLVVGGPL